MVRDTRSASRTRARGSSGRHGNGCAATVARLHHLWVDHDDRLHVRVRHSTGRLASPDDRRVPLDGGAHRVCVHYSTRGGFAHARDPLTLALAEMFACSDPGAVLATVDSALDRGELQMSHLDLLREQMPRSRRVLIDRVDPDCQSGLETRVGSCCARSGSGSARRPPSREWAASTSSSGTGSSSRSMGVRSTPVPRSRRTGDATSCSSWVGTRCSGSAIAR